MRLTISRSDLAAYATMEAEPMLACTRALTRYPELQGQLAQNVNLPSPVWRQLWGKRPELNRAIDLVSRQLPRPDRDVVLSGETRSRVLCALIEHNVLSLDEQEDLLRTAPDAALSCLLEQSWVDPSLRVRLARHVGGLSLLSEIAYDTSGAFTDDEVSSLLDTFDTWVPEGRFRERSHLLKVLLFLRPSLVATAARSSVDSLVTAAAGSLNLSADLARVIAGLDPASTLGDKDLVDRRFALLALVNNPVVGLDVVSEVVARCEKVAGLEQVVSSYDRRKTRPGLTVSYTEVSDPEQITWLVRRSLPSEYHPARSMELILLAQNPHLDDASRVSVESAAITELYCDPRLGHALKDSLLTVPAFVPVVTELTEPVTAAPRKQRHASLWGPVSTFCQAAELRLGGQAEQWEVAVGLLDEFDGTVEDLLELAVRI